jgi:nicotinamidase-related amidase
MDFSLPSRGSVALVVVDVQEKFAPAIFEWERVLENTVRIIKGFRALSLPIVVTEQYPKGLGKTVPEVAAALEGIAPIEKTSFDCFGERKFVEALKKTGARDVVLCGIESHVCILQTALSAQKAGYRVHLLPKKNRLQDRPKADDARRHPAFDD